MCQFFPNIASKCLHVFIAFFLRAVIMGPMGSESKKRLLNAALELFSMYGYSRVTTKAIAYSAGVNEATLFRIFKKKRNLYIDVFNNFAVKPSPELLLGKVTYNLSSDLTEIGEIITRLFLANSSIVKMSYSALETEIQEVVSELRQQIIDLGEILVPYFSEMKKRKRIKGDPAELAPLFSNTVFAFSAHSLKMEPAEALTAKVRTLSEIFAKGIDAAP